MSAYQSYLNGELVDYEYPAAAVKKVMQQLPKVKMEA